MKVLVAVDGSVYTERALDYLIHHGWLFAGNEVVVLHVVLPLPHRAAAFSDVSAVKGYYDDDARLVLRPIQELLAQRSVPARFVHEIGHPAECIARHAQDDRYDLLVMGSHGHGALANVVLGSVAAKVLALCKTPVLLIR